MGRVVRAPGSRARARAAALHRGASLGSSQASEVQVRTSEIAAQDTRRLLSQPPGTLDDAVFLLELSQPL